MEPEDELGGLIDFTGVTDFAEVALGMDFFTPVGAGIF